LGNNSRPDVPLGRSISKEKRFPIRVEHSACRHDPPLNVDGQFDHVPEGLFGKLANLLCGHRVCDQASFSGHR